MKQAFLFLAFAGFFLMVQTADAAKQPSKVIYEQGFLSLETTSEPLVSLLEKIAAAADIEIYLTETIASRPTRVDYDRLPLKDVLGSLLRGYSYAVIFKQGKTDGGRVYLYSKKNTFNLPAFQGVESEKKVVSASLPELSGRNKRTAASIEEKAPTANSIQQIDSFVSRQQSNQTNVSSVPRQASNKGEFGYTAGRASSGIYEPTAYGNGVLTQASDGNSSETANSGEGTTTVMLDSVGSQSVTETEPVTNQETPQYADDEIDITSLSETEISIIRLEYQIKKLKADIESGRAAREYDLWASRKDPAYIYDPWKDLASKEEELEQLKEN